MIDLKNIQNIYFIGIGGIGMSALARYFKAQGKTIYGYDKTPTPLTTALQAEGITIFFEDNLKTVVVDVDFVIYTPAIPKDNFIFNYYAEGNYSMEKRSTVLGWITKNNFNICVAGTHGKTTVTTMIAHILRDSGYGCNAFLGGIPTNYQTNFWSSDKNIVVVEADEYDRSFLQLQPNIAVITSMDPDHLDIYHTTENFENAFIDFSHKIKPNGGLISNYNILQQKSFQVANNNTYSIDNPEATFYAKDIEIIDNAYNFSVCTQSWSLKNLRLQMGGLHNIENAVGAIAVAKYLGVEDEKIAAAISNFRGIKRRFEFMYQDKNFLLIDDYAHHPIELKALIAGVKNLFNNQSFTLVFQPHLYSRTKDFFESFAAILSEAPQVILLPIYPAREAPIEGVNSEMIQKTMTNPNVQVLSKNAYLDWVKTQTKGIIVMAGAGDIDALLAPAKNILEQKNLTKN